MARLPGGGEPSFSYVFEFHRVGAPASPWQPLMSGTFGLGRGHGELALDLELARKSGYPVAEFKELAAPDPRLPAPRVPLHRRR